MSEADSQAVSTFSGPLWLKICRQAYFWVTMIAGIGGMLFTFFIPTEAGSWISVGGALAFCAFGLFLFMVVPDGASRSFDERLGGVVFFGLFSFLLGLPATHLALSIYTQSVGVPAEKREKVLYWKDSSGRSCRGAVVPNIHWYPQTVCMGRNGKLKFREGAPITLYGPATKFGMNVDGVS